MLQTKLQYFYFLRSQNSFYLYLQRYSRETMRRGRCSGAEKTGQK